MNDKHTKRMLDTVGKKTFVACFEARLNRHDDLSKKEVHKLCLPDSTGWKERSLATKTSSVKKIFREKRHCHALQICCNAKRIKETQQKAQSLYAKYCPDANSPQ